LSYGHTIDPHALSAEDRHHGFLALNLIGAWDDWIKRRVESIEFDSDMTVRRRVSVDFRLREWLPDPILDWDGKKYHYVPIALLNKEPLLRFDLHDENGSAVPLLTRRKNAAIAAATLASMAQLSIWTRLGTAIGWENLANDPTRPSNPRLIQLPREIEDTLVNIAFLPYENAKGAKDILHEFLKPDLPATSTPLSRWTWSEVEDPETKAPLWAYDKGGLWRYELARDPKMRALLSDLAELWMVAIPVAHEPGRRRIIKFCYCEHRLEPQLRLIARVKDTADHVGAGGLLGRVEDRLEGLPRDQVGEKEWDQQVGGPPERLGLWTRLSQALGWQGHVVKFDVPAVGKGGSYHLDLTAPDGTQIRQAALGAVDEHNQVLEAKVQRGARGLLNAHLYVGNLPAGVQGEASITLKPRTTTIVRSLAMLAIAAFVMLALARWKLVALTDRKHGTSGNLAPIFLLFPGLGAAAAARGTEHSMTTSMLFGLRISAIGVALAPITGASLLAIARRWPHIGLAWWVLVIWSGLLMMLLLISWRLAGRRRPDGGAP
jgi:hypothetical protein